MNNSDIQSSISIIGQMFLGATDEKFLSKGSLKGFLNINPTLLDLGIFIEAHLFLII